MLQNIWQHPKTSLAGLLIAIVTVTGVLSQQGITLGNAGTGTVVALIGALAAALLGLLARDPTPGPSVTGTRLGLFVLVCLLPAIAAVSGCRAAAVNPPTAPGVNALNVLARVTAGLNDVQAAEQAAYAEGLIAKADQAKIDAGFTAAGKDLALLTKAVQDGESTLSLHAKVEAIFTDLESGVSEGLGSVKDPTRKAELTTALAAVEIILDQVVFTSSARPVPATAPTNP